jgi:hypothetical protein
MNRVNALQTCRTGVLWCDQYWFALAELPKQAMDHDMRVQVLLQALIGATRLDALRLKRATEQTATPCVRVVV